MKITAIALNTFRETSRNRIFYVLIAFALVVILTSRAVAWISAGADLKVIMDMGLASITFFNVIMAIFLGTSIVINEMDRKTLYTILSKPMKRSEYILGKYCGLCLSIAISILMMSLFLVLYYKLMAWMLSSPGSSLGPIINACFFIFIEISLLTGVAVLLSLLSSPILSAVFSFCMFILGHSTRGLVDLTEWIMKARDLSNKEVYNAFLKILYYILPNLDNFDYKLHATHNVLPDWKTILLSLAYGVVYTAALLMISIFIFNRKKL